VGLSPHHFSRLFRLSTGLPPHQYAIRRRAEKAKALLLRGHPPGLAALEAGFHDQSHMGRHFKRLFGTTPKGALKEAPETGKNVL
jgi:AraC-like DNA-binding protein